jgi:hypothetical protein
VTGVFAGPAFWVDGPKPVAPLYRLLDVANIIEETDPHWMNGATVWGYPSDVPVAWDPCSTGTGRVKADGGTIPLPDFGAFVVYLAETCTARSVFGAQAPGETNDEYLARTQQAFVDRAVAVFAASESYAIEKEFSQGDALPGNPYLADANAQVLASGAAVSPRIGLSYLLNAIAPTARQGIIHATPGTVSAWGQFRAYHEAGVLYTTEGTPIAEGQGYIGAQPAGESAPTATHEWAFATGPVDVHRSQAVIYPATVAEALDRSNNTLSYRVERTYLVDWDTVLQAAVLIDWTALP